MNNKNVGVIGLGAMGLGIARSLLRNGFNVHACDVREAVTQQFASEGGVACSSPAHMAGECDVIITVVVNAEQTETVLFGEHSAAAALRPGSLVIGCATVAPTYAVELGKRLADAGLLYLDAPISGGAAKAAAGEMTMMTSGPAQAYAKADDVLAGMAGKVYRLGDVHGLGSKVKIINQLLGLREGVDADALYEVITHSAGNSWMFENRVPHILKADYTPLSAVDIFVKDLGLVLDTARASKFPLPLSATAHQMFMQASSAGFGREDDSAVIKIFPGIELPTAKPDSV
jgi:3-hydroxyisobutyrate dehydrogenase